MNKNLKIKEVLKERGITLSELAEKMGITKGTLSQALNGNPTINYIERISKILGCKISYLIK